MSTKSREEGAMCTWRGGDVAVIWPLTKKHVQTVGITTEK